MPVDFLSNAPKYITDRFNSINTYVWQSLFPEDVINYQMSLKNTKVERKKELKRLKSISSEATIVVFIFLINKFFNDGSEAAIQAVDTFKELGVQGFSIGNSFFAERNGNVMKGRELSSLFLSSIKEESVKSLVEQSNYISQILDVYRKQI